MWYEYLHNSTFICMLYKDVPDLENIEIAGVQVVSDGPTIKIGFDFPRFADFPPKKWDPSFNTVGMVLEFCECSDLFWKGWCDTNIGSISITKESSGSFSVLVKTNEGQISFKSRFIFTQDIHGTCRRDRV